MQTSLSALFTYAIEVGAKAEKSIRGRPMEIAGNRAFSGIVRMRQTHLRNMVLTGARQG
jgi:hypothetical protein